MSIIIKGMNMPSSCMECPLYNGHGCTATNTMFSNMTNVAVRTKECPLIEIPKGARLIDANKINSDMDDMKVEGETFVTAVNFVKLIVNDAPVIFEEDKE